MIDPTSEAYQSQGAGAPVKITPGMIDAGLDAYLACDPAADTAATIVRAVYEAMTAACDTGVFRGQSRGAR